MSRFQMPTISKSSWQLINSLVPYLILWFVAIELADISYWLALPTAVIAAGFLIRIFIIMHDCGHGSFFRSPKTNNFWGVVTGILAFTPYHYWKSSHARHHATSGNLDKRGVGDIWTLTVEEYLKASRMTRLKYRVYRNPVVMFVFGPPMMLLVTYRYPGFGSNRADRKSILGNNLAIILIGSAMSLLIGWQTYLLIQGTVLFVSFVAGVWLFYVQHQFEDVYWARDKEWDFVSASLDGGSYYELPAVLRWFTGTIGFHHIHHLNSRIPNYNLRHVQKKIEDLEPVKSIRFWSAFKSLAYRLWDEEHGRLVGFGELRRRRKVRAAA